MFKKSADKIVENKTCSILADKIGQFCQPTKSGNFCMTHNRFLSGDNRPILSFVWHPLYLLHIASCHRHNCKLR